MLLGARDLAKGEAAAAELKKEGIDARPVKLDVDNAADHAAVAKLIEKEFGSARYSDQQCGHHAG